MTDSDCPAIFHHTTARGYCSRCGKTWKSWHKKRAEREQTAKSESALADRTPAQPTNDAIADGLSDALGTDRSVNDVAD